MSNRARKWSILGCLALLVLAGLWLCVFVVRSPISLVQFQRLKLNMNRVEVEGMLGGKASVVSQLDVDEQIDIRLGPPEPLKLGEFSGRWHNLGETMDKDRRLAQVQRWDGPEGQLWVLFDSNGLLANAIFAERVTWRTMLGEALP